MSTLVTGKIKLMNKMETGMVTQNRLIAVRGKGFVGSLDERR